VREKSFHRRKKFENDEGGNSGVGGIILDIYTWSTGFLMKDKDGLGLSESK